MPMYNEVKVEHNMCLCFENLSHSGLILPIPISLDKKSLFCPGILNKFVVQMKEYLLVNTLRLYRCYRSCCAYLYNTE